MYNGHGVAVVLGKNFSKSVLSFWPKIDHMLLVKIKACRGRAQKPATYNKEYKRSQGKEAAGKCDEDKNP